MKKNIKIALTVFIMLIMIFGITFCMIWSNRNTAVALEERIEAQYTANKSNYDSMWKTVVEMTQVTDKQAEHFKDVYLEIIGGRYEDTKLLFKSIKEQNPQLNTDIYIELQREISAGRKVFDNNQKNIADIIREYNIYVKKHIIMSFLTGRQPKNMEDYIVTSKRTSEAFESKKDDVININGK